MSFEFQIALRYLKTKRHGLFGLLTTLIAIGGITLGVAALIVTLAVMNGFRSDIQDKTLGIQPHILLLGTEEDSKIAIDSLLDKINLINEVVAVAPYILGQTLLKSKRGTQGIAIRGIETEKEFSVTGAEKTLISGEWSVLNSADPKDKSLILGKELARNLGLSLGSEVIVISPTEKASLGAMGAVPRMEKFKVGGIFQSGFYEYDANLAFTSLTHARRLFAIGGASGLGIKTTDLEEADLTATMVSETAGMKYWTRSWQSLNRNLFEALKLEKIVMTIILTMIILVASFTIISNLILMSIQKATDIGILKALGASRASIKKIFFYAGMVLGTTGIFLGTVIGISLVEVLDRTQWIRLPQDVYYLDTLPVRLSGLDLSIVLVSAFIITVLSAVYPASQAAKINPVDAIRYG